MASLLHGQESKCSVSTVHIIPKLLHATRAPVGSDLCSDLPTGRVLLTWQVQSQTGFAHVPPAKKFVFRPFPVASDRQATGPGPGSVPQQAVLCSEPGIKFLGDSIRGICGPLFSDHPPLARIMIRILTYMKLKASKESGFQVSGTPHPASRNSRGLSSPPRGSALESSPGKVSRGPRKEF